MVPPFLTQELHYLNKEDRLLRWLVKHRDAVYGLEFINDDDRWNEMTNFRLHRNKDDDDGIVDEFDYEVDFEYEVKE